MDPTRVAGFLILERSFPRSIRFSGSRRPGRHQRHPRPFASRGNVIDPAERILGRLDAQLEYSELSEILSEGIPNYLQRIQTAVTKRPWPSSSPILCTERFAKPEARNQNDESSSKPECSKQPPGSP
jgi:hypothetical protein